jgi:hypothetical protein
MSNTPSAKTDLAVVVVVLRMIPPSSPVAARAPLSLIRLCLTCRMHSACCHGCDLVNPCCIKSYSYNACSGSEGECPLRGTPVKGLTDGPLKCPYVGDCSPRGPYRTAANRGGHRDLDPRMRERMSRCGMRRAVRCGAPPLGGVETRYVDPVLTSQTAVGARYRWRDYATRQ